MKQVIVAVLSLVFFPGCSSMFTASTTASYITPDGKQISYSSNRDLTGLDVTYIMDGDKVKEVRIRVDQAGTSQAVIQAVAEQQAAIADILKTLAPLAKAGAGIP